MKRLSAVPLTMAVALATCSALGDIIASSGGVEILPTPPASVAINVYQNNTAARVFLETSDLVLAQAVTVDITQSGAYTASNLTSTTGTLDAGLAVRSYFIHFDPSSNSNVTASLTFSETILGEDSQREGLREKGKIKIE